MDVQNQRKNHSGQEVHFCPKCGWPYPNPHPSAKHRRAHHRVCGTIEGYKSGVDPDSHSNVPEDDHDHDHDHSDEEQHPTLSTGSKVLERNLDEGGSKDITEKPDGPREEAFLDAVTHFPGTAPTPLHEECSFTVGETVDENSAVDLNGLEAPKDGTRSVEIGQKTLNSSYTSVQTLLDPKNASQELSDTEIKEPSTCSTEQEEATFLEAPNDFLDQSHGVAAPSSLDVGSEPTMDSSAEAGISADPKIVNEQLADDPVKEGDIIVNERTQPVPSLLTKDDGVIFAAESSEEFTSVEDTISTVHRPETPDAVSRGNLPVENLKEDKDFQTYVIPKDIPVIEQPETLIEGYKDFSVPKFLLVEDLDTPDTILQKGDSSVLVSKDSFLLEIKVQKELSDVPSSDHILPKDKSEPDGDLKEPKEYVPIIPEGGDNACKSEKLEAETIDQDLSIQDLPVESSITASHEIKATKIPHDSGENNLSESHVKHGTIVPEFLAQQNEVQDKSMTNIIEVEMASDTEKTKTEQAVVTEAETREGYFEGNGNLKATTAEYAVESEQLDGVSARDTANVRKDVECSEEGELSVVDVETTPESTIRYQVDKEAVHVQSSDSVSPSQGSVAVENNQCGDPSLTTPKIPTEDEFVDNFFKTEPVVSAPERSVDLNSRTDSLEANWGSISVLSTQSDPSVTTESELLTPAHDVTPTDAGEFITEAEGKGSEKTDVFEAPSFLTLVEPRVGTNQTDGALAQQEDKKNGGIIPNQGAGAGKHHFALKNLLVEATQESKLKSSSQKDSFASVQKDETAEVTTVGKILGADDRKSGGSIKEWDSPARYPADIKREKRKVKGHWMPFICCSSVN